MSCSFYPEWNEALKLHNFSFNISQNSIILQQKIHPHTHTPPHTPQLCIYLLKRNQNVLTKMNTGRLWNVTFFSCKYRLPELPNENTHQNNEHTTHIWTWNFCWQKSSHTENVGYIIHCIIIFKDGKVRNYLEISIIFWQVENTSWIIAYQRKMSRGKLRQFCTKKKTVCQCLRFCFVFIYVGSHQKQNLWS